MDQKISVVINTLNEEKNIESAIRSVVDWADEVLVCDMHSEDNSAVIAKKMGAKVIFCRRSNYVEPSRNFAISKASHEWILIMDPDEEIPEALMKRLKDMLKKPIVSTYVEVPRRNIIFGKWVKSSMWWPDYNIRFFRKGHVTWSGRIHRPPKTEGQGIKLPVDERWAITHHHYNSIEQFIERMNRYTSVQAKELKEDKVEAKWQDLLIKPLEEFLNRYFANRGFEDGMHGLLLGLLQAFSQLVVYAKLWGMESFREERVEWEDFKTVTLKAGEDMDYWLKYGNLSRNPLKRALQKAKNRLA